MRLTVSMVTKGQLQTSRYRMCLNCRSPNQASKYSSLSAVHPTMDRDTSFPNDGTFGSFEAPSMNIFLMPEISTRTSVCAQADMGLMMHWRASVFNPAQYGTSRASKIRKLRVLRKGKDIVSHGVTNQAIHGSINDELV
jgi:hypothetical protein